MDHASLRLHPRDGGWTMHQKVYIQGEGDGLRVSRTASRGREMDQASVELHPWGRDRPHVRRTASRGLKWTSVNRTASRVWGMDHESVGLHQVVGGWTMSR